jgi:hypothetical protein
MVERTGAPRGPGGVILFSPTSLGPIWKVDANGGAASPLTVLRRPIEKSHLFPKSRRRASLALTAMLDKSPSE